MLDELWPYGHRVDDARVVSLEVGDYQFEESASLVGPNHQSFYFVQLDHSER
jgi:hypothetical protein